MPDNKVWRQNCREVSDFFARCETVQDAMDVKSEFGEIALKSYPKRDEPLSTGKLAETLLNLSGELDNEVEAGEKVKVKNTSAWSEFRKYFTSEEGIRKNVGELYYEGYSNDAVIKG